MRMMLEFVKGKVVLPVILKLILLLILFVLLIIVILMRVIPLGIAPLRPCVIVIFCALVSVRALVIV